MRSGALFLCLALLVATVAGFMTAVTRPASRMALKMVATEEKTIKKIDSPDFYWQFRLDRLKSKKSGDLSFDAKNYPDVGDNAKDLYDAYYLDLTLQGKMEGFDWVAEKEITDAEWMGIYKNICKWSNDAVKNNKPDNSNLPANDFDLLKQFYPQLDYREIESEFVAAEVGANFPYPNMKEMLNAAMAGKLNVPGYTAASVTSLEATEVRKQLSQLKQKSMEKVEAIFKDTIAYAENPFPDAAAKSHYSALRSKLADFPQNPAGWAKFRENMEKEVDEMARLASKKADEHHHHEEGEEEKMSPSQEFEAKYGRKLDEMQERFNRFKANPEAFLENSIIEKFGKNGLDIWKKSQEFSKQMSVMSASDKAATEKAFSDFISKA